MKILIDSSILVEFENKRKPELLKALLESSHTLLLNGIVASE